MHVEDPGELRIGRAKSTDEPRLTGVGAMKT
jgi:hypothetical protein